MVQLPQRPTSLCQALIPLPQPSQEKTSALAAPR